MIPHTGSRAFSGLGLAFLACPNVGSLNPSKAIKPMMSRLLFIEFLGSLQRK
jgi:hypothetical protein